MLTEEELTTYRSDVLESMNDECIIHQRSVTQDGAGQPVVTYVADSGRTPCGIRFTTTAERAHQRENSLDVIDAKIRLPHGTSLEAGDRVQVVERYGTAVDLTFDVVGKPEPGLGALIAYLRWSQ